jgi:hypothetical protein
VKNLAQELKYKLRAILNVFADRSDYRPPHCGNIRTLLLHLCDMDEQLCLWVLRWLAFPLRNSGAKMSTAVIINGYNGTGMSLFFERVAARLHGDNGRVITARQLHDGFFSRYVAASSLVAVDGPVAPRHVARLKELISAESIIVSDAGQAPRTRPNRLNFVFMSSSPDFLPEDIGNRRFVVIEAPPARQASFYEAIRHEIEHGGVDAFREYLMRDLVMGDFNADTPPPAPACSHREAA